jgi:hypothetical protein
VPYTAQQLGDLAAIRDAAQRYCHGVDRLDPDSMRSAYWPDATDDHGTFVGNAHEFVAHCMTAHVRWRSTLHCITNHQIELDDDGVHARGEIYNVTYLFRADEPVLDTWWGRYLDDYEARDGEWRILRRVCVHEGNRSEALTATMPIAADRFRPGSFDRPSAGRRLGP